MYDPEIGRITTIDRFSEKYYSMSTYQYGADNPIRFIDINGESIWVSYKGKDILYESGKLYNQDGTVYIGKEVKKDGTYKSFLGKAVGALTAIAGTKEGGSLISELQVSSNNFYLEKSSTNSFDENPSQRLAAYANQAKTDPRFAHLLKTNPVSAFAGGSGGVIKWNPSGGNVWVIGDQNNSPVANLGHELFHGRDANQGLLDDRTHQGLKRSEWQAVYKENVLRSQLGLPLREYYRTQDNAGTRSPLPPRILDSKNNPIRPTWIPSIW